MSTTYTRTRSVSVNRLWDFMDRVGWTVIMAVLAAVLTVLTSDGISWQEGVKFVVIAGIGTTIKVLAAQRAGSDNLGAAVPGKVIEEK